MAYQSTKPLANDKLSTSQGDIAGNFTEINTYVNIDHEAFNIADQGKHKRVFFTQQAADPATGATEAAIYTKDSSVPGSASLYYRPPNSGTPIEFTYALKADPGWCILPSGIMFQWGTGIIPAGSTGLNIALPIPFPNGNLTCQATPSAVSPGDQRDIVMTINPNGLANVHVTRSVGFTGWACNFRFLAIGY